MTTKKYCVPENEDEFSRLDRSKYSQYLHFISNVLSKKSKNGLCFDDLTDLKLSKINHVILSTHCLISLNANQNQKT